MNTDTMTLNPTKESTDIQDFHQSSRPHVALVTNHGYGGVSIPYGGAVDTGGQNVYVNSYARALDNLGYKVTVYARGGFSFYESERLRSGEELLTPYVRYVYVPGGGSEFIRKEDISIALIEELEWMYERIEKEAAALNQFPWQYYEMVNTHYWDAGVLGVSLVVKWQNDICARMIQHLTEGLVKEKKFKKFYSKRHSISISKAPAYSLGKLLLDGVAGKDYVHDEETMTKVFETWAKESPLAKQIPESIGQHIDWLNLRSTIAAATVPLRPLVLAEVLGNTVLNQQIHKAVFEDPAFRKYRSYSDLETFGDVLEKAHHGMNNHVWTPHSLGVIKEWNFRKKPLEVQRNLKFRERRSHERMICDYTPAFGATSYEIAQSLVANYGAKIDDVLYYPPGVDIDLFKDFEVEEMDEVVEYLHRKTGISPQQLKSSIVILETSRMDLTKRKDVVVKAFEQVAEKNDQVILLISGGPENGVYHGLNDMIGDSETLSGRAHLLGYVEEKYLPLLFGFADIYVSASEMEGFGMSVAQAAVNGKPIVSSDKIPFTSYYISDEALVVRAGDIGGFAKALDFFVNNPQEREARGKMIQQKAMGLEWENLTIKFLQDLNKKGFDIPITEYVAKKLSI
jgi:glycosyltransferase involved in cell wall biosynthesis